MIDSRAINTHYREPCTQRYRYAGQGAAVPTANPNCPDALRATIARTGVGAITINCAEYSGFVQAYHGTIGQPPGTDGQKSVIVQPPTDASFPLTFTMQVAYTANGVNVDVVAGEELIFMLDRSLGRP